MLLITEQLLECRGGIKVHVLGFVPVRSVSLLLRDDDGRIEQIGARQGSRFGCDLLTRECRAQTKHFESQLGSLARERNILKRNTPNK